MKSFIVEITVSDEELAEARRLWAIENYGKPCPSNLVALARDIQAFAYDIGGMHGDFRVIDCVYSTYPIETKDMTL